MPISNDQLRELGFEPRTGSVVSPRNAVDQRLSVGGNGDWRYGANTSLWRFVPIPPPETLADLAVLMRTLGIPLGPLNEPFDVTWMCANGFEMDPDDSLYVRVLLHRSKPESPIDTTTAYLCVYCGPDQGYFGLICIMETYGSGRCEYFTEIRYGTLKTKADVLMLLKALKLET